jgi:hypothetical protein
MAPLTAGKTPSDSGRQIDVIGIRRLLGQTALFDIRTEVFSTEKQNAITTVSL